MVITKKKGPLGLRVMYIIKPWGGSAPSESSKAQNKNYFIFFFAGAAPYNNHPECVATKIYFFPFGNLQKKIGCVSQPEKLFSQKRFTIYDLQLFSSSPKKPVPSEKKNYIIFFLNFSSPKNDYSNRSLISKKYI